MDIDFSYKSLSSKEKFFKRLFECLPGISSWGILIGLSFTAFFKPLLVCGIVVAFSLFWSFNMVYKILFLKQSMKRFKIEESYANWIKRAKGLDDISAYLKSLHFEKEIEANSDEDQSYTTNREEISILRESKQMPMLFDDIHHLIILDVEAYSSQQLDAFVVSLQGQTFNPEMVMLGLIAKDKNVSRIKPELEQLKANYGDFFYGFEIIEFPISGAGSSENKAEILNFSAEKSAQIFKEKNVSFQDVIVTFPTTVDPLNRQFLASLTYHFMVTPNRFMHSYQPLPIYEGSDKVSSFNANLNFLEVNAAFNPSFVSDFLPISLCLQSLTQSRFFPVDVVNFKLVYFWKTYLQHNAKAKVVPFVVKYPLNKSSQISKDSGMFSIGNINLFSFLMRTMRKQRSIPIQKRISIFLKLMASYFIISVWPLFICVIGYLGAFMTGQKFTETTFYYSTDSIRLTILILAISAFLLSVSYSYLLYISFGYKSKEKQGGDNLVTFALNSFVSFFIAAFTMLLKQIRLLLGLQQ